MIHTFTSFITFSSVISFFTFLFSNAIISHVKLLLIFINFVQNSHMPRLITGRIRTLQTFSSAQPIQGVNWHYFNLAARLQQGAASQWFHPGSHSRNVASLMLKKQCSSVPSSWQHQQRKRCNCKCSYLIPFFSFALILYFSFFHFFIVTMQLFPLPPPLSCSSSLLRASSDLYYRTAHSCMESRSSIVDSFLDASTCKSSFIHFFSTCLMNDDKAAEPDRPIYRIILPIALSVRAL